MRASHRREAFLVACLSIAFVSCGSRGDDTAPILLFGGTGASPNDVRAVEAILNRNGFNYSTVSSSKLNRFSASDFGRYSLLIVPGGNFIEIGNSLNSGTTATIRTAVQNGLNYLGICAGAFLAGNASGYNGLNLTSGVKFGFYSAERQGIRKAVVAVSVDGGPTLDQYWEDGPELTGWGTLIAKYPDGTPAVVEGAFGRGWVVLTGVHPEAPAKWRSDLNFTTPVEADNAYAGTLIRAALNRSSLARR